VGNNLPLIAVIALAGFWLTCMFYGTESLYRRKSPLFIIYCGSWLCYYLFYSRWMKVHNVQAMHTMVKVTLTIAFILAAIFGLFGSDKAPKQREKQP